MKLVAEKGGRGRGGSWVEEVRRGRSWERERKKLGEEEVGTPRRATSRSFNYPYGEHTSPDPETTIAALATMNRAKPLAG